MSNEVGELLMEWDGSDDDPMAWDDFMMELDTLLDDRNPSRKWFAKVKGFGWRNLDGHKRFEAKDANDFLNEILPKTECHFKIFEYGKDGIAIQNYHHDSPVGNEWYYVVADTKGGE